MHPLPPSSHGTHGGPLLPHFSGYVELAVFETGVPPRFRLHFLDEKGQPVAPPAAETVTAETERPGAVRQPFVFRREEDFLESTTDIPEPHEFLAYVKLDGGREQLATLFTEEGHEHGTGHDHAEEHGMEAHEDPGHGNHDHGAQGHAAHGHAHGHDAHDHDHGGGLWGWVRGTFAHSHDVTDKVDAEMESNEKGIRALKISLVGLGITALIQVLVVLYSGSVALLADTIHNFADAATSIPLWVAFALTRRGTNRRFTYGYGKTEDVAGVIIVGVIFFSACVAGYEALLKLIHPEPMTHLGWVMVASLVGFIGNEAVAVYRIRVGREIGSAALIADGQHSRVDGFTSLSVLIGVLGTWLGYPLVDPLVGIGITITILFIVKDAAQAVWHRLIDGIEPEILDEILHAPSHVAGVRAVRVVRARWIGHKVYSDVAIAVDPNLPVRVADAIAKAVENALREHVRLLGEVVVRVTL
ncbi:MAG: cation transporter [Magnetococcales bacterium]|nr:cation transporter [Magnetococcales bacterium]